MNIAEKLKSCQTGMKLYSSIHGEVEFICINGYGDKYPIKCKDKSGYEESFTSDGRVFHDYPDAECVLFPSKKQRDWSKFRLHAKNGDIMMLENGTRPFIFRKYLNYSTGIEGFISDFYCGITKSNELEIKTTNNPHWTMDFIIPASEEAKKELFDKIAESGYKWNADSLKLEKIEHKFKEGDVLINNNTLFLFTGVIINNMLQVYCLCANGTFMDCSISISSLKLASVTDRNKLFNAIIENGYKYDKEQHKLVKQEFKPFDKVLVRNNICESWKCSFFSHYQTLYGVPYLFVTTSESYKYCIPYKDNEYLLGKTINPYMI